MKIQEIKHKDLGKCMDRISLAFHTHFPNVEWGANSPDLKLVYLFGDGEKKILDQLDNLDNVILFQITYFTGDIPPETWLPYWKRAKLVISFHDLKSYYPNEDFNFLLTPLGAEPELFPVSLEPRTLKVFTTGHVFETECLDSIFLACTETKTKMYHTGEDFKWYPEAYQFLPYMNDAEFLGYLQKSQYIAGLRLIEGFEMMCIEGAMTGAVPIVPNLPTYSFYKDIGIYIDVNKNIVQQLKDVFERPYSPLTLEQIKYTRETFAWSTICKPLYNRIIA